jgi:hypothetical protein
LVLLFFGEIHNGVERAAREKKNVERRRNEQTDGECTLQRTREGEIKRDDMKINPVLNILSEFVHRRACICIRVFAHNNHRG